MTWLVIRTAGTWISKSVIHLRVWNVLFALFQACRLLELVPFPADEQAVQPEPRAVRFLKSVLVGRGPVNLVVELNRFVRARFCHRSVCDMDRVGLTLGPVCRDRVPGVGILLGSARDCGDVGVA